MKENEKPYTVLYDPCDHVQVAIAASTSYCLPVTSVEECKGGKYLVVFRLHEAVMDRYEVIVLVNLTRERAEVPEGVIRVSLHPDEIYDNYHCYPFVCTPMSLWICHGMATKSEIYYGVRFYQQSGKITDLFTYLHDLQQGYTGYDELEEIMIAGRTVLTCARMVEKDVIPCDPFFLISREDFLPGEDGPAPKFYCSSVNIFVCVPAFLKEAVLDTMGQEVCVFSYEYFSEVHFPDRSTATVGVGYSGIKRHILDSKIKLYK